MDDAGNHFFDNLADTEKEQFTILFEPKDDGFEIEKYEKALASFIAIQNNSHKHYGIQLDYIIFYDFNFKNQLSEIKKLISFRFTTFHGETNFNNINFNGKADFAGAKFNGKADFIGAKFSGEAFFNSSRFGDEAYFHAAKFKDKAWFASVEFSDLTTFSESKFSAEATFYATTCEGYFSLHDARIREMSLIGFKADNAIFIDIKGLDENDNEVVINKNNFTNKESARLIKALFEKQGNITEANKYFVIEQEKYIEELRSKENITEGGKWTKLIPLYANKCISNFGTDWARAVLFLFIFAVLSNLIYGSFNDKLVSVFSLDLSKWIEITKDYLNTLTKMVNPLNAFKAKDNIFENYEFFGAIVRVTSAVIIYQIIVAFRQFTRRA